MEGIIIVMFLERQNAQHHCIATSHQAGGHHYYEFVANTFGFLAVSHCCRPQAVALLNHSHVSGSVSECWLSPAVLNKVLEGVGEMLRTSNPHNSHTWKFHLITINNNN